MERAHRYAPAGLGLPDPMSELNRREMSRRGLLGSEEGWSLAPVAAWLAIEGRLILDPVALLNTLTTRLDAAGARIDRLGFTLGTIHPQILAWGVFWTRSRGAAEFSGWGTEWSTATLTSAARCSSCASISARSGVGSKRSIKRGTTPCCTSCAPAI